VVFQHLQRRHRRFGIKIIDIAGNEESYTFQKIPSLIRIFRFYIIFIQK
jgi:hypothetical protein